MVARKIKWKWVLAEIYALAILTAAGVVLVCLLVLSHVYGGVWVSTPCREAPYEIIGIIVAIVLAVYFMYKRVIMWSASEPEVCETKNE